MSANVDDARLGRRLGWRFRLCRKLKHRCLLTLMQVRQENKRAIRKFECVMMSLRYVLVDLSKDRRSDRAREHLSARPKRYRSGRAGRQHGECHAACSEGTI